MSEDLNETNKPPLQEMFEEFSPVLHHLDSRLSAGVPEAIARKDIGHLLYLVKAIAGPEPLLAFSLAWAAGRTKYPKMNWRNVPIDAFWHKVARHCVGHYTEVVDAEMGVPHLSLMLFNIMAIIWLEEKGKR